MADTDYERRSTQDYIDRAPNRYDASSGWGMAIGVFAVVAILVMLFVGFGTGTRVGTPSQPAIERTAPPPAPTTKAPTEQPAPAPTQTPKTPQQ